MIQQPPDPHVTASVAQWLDILTPFMLAAGVIWLRKTYAARDTTPGDPADQVPSRKEMEASLAKTDVDLRQFVNNTVTSAEVMASTRHMQAMEAHKEVKEWLIKAYERADDARDIANAAKAGTERNTDALSHEREMRESEVRRLEVVRGDGDR